MSTPLPQAEPDDEALTEALVQLLLADWFRRHPTEALPAALADEHTNARGVAPRASSVQYTLNPR